MLEAEGELLNSTVSINRLTNCARSSPCPKLINLIYMLTRDFRTLTPNNTKTSAAFGAMYLLKPIFSVSRVESRGVSRKVSVESFAIRTPPPSLTNILQIDPIRSPKIIFGAEDYTFFGNPLYLCALLHFCQRYF